MTFNDTLLKVSLKQLNTRASKFCLVLLIPFLLTFHLTGSPQSNNIDLLKGIDSKGSKPLIRLIAGYSNDSMSFDPLVIYYDDDATYNFDGQYDALKIFNTDRNVTNYYVYSNDKRELSINGVPFSDSTTVFDLGLKTEKDGDIVFRIKDIDEDLCDKTLVLSDKVTGINKVLRPDEEYTIYLPASHYLDRFILSISSPTTGSQDIRLSNDAFKVFSSDGVINIEIPESQKVYGIITTINMAGKLLFRRRVDFPGHYKFDLGLEKGIYIVSYVSGGKICTKKLFVGNK